MSNDYLERQLHAAAASIRCAHDLLRIYIELFDRFEGETKDLELFGPVLAPALFIQQQREPWREDVRQAFRAAACFVREMDDIAKRHAAREPAAQEMR